LPRHVSDILVPIDSVPNAGVGRLVELARGYSARLTLVHVVAVVPYPPPVSMVDMYRSMIDEGEEMLERTRRRVEMEGIEVRTKLLIGVPGPTIVDESRDYDLVVMVMPHRPWILDRILDLLKAVTFSDVRRPVTRRALCPVLTVRVGGPDPH